ncbi:3-phosphoshikimate 1-carboxyvinyltransferase [Bacillus spongiae]|uniref:3-phosphoshikimate 1-carboxyvinyltransferase n=1 Tax=Bacillus spongiae TaxID=2683610 RepID=A0ABU8HHX2_9BACI
MKKNEGSNTRSIGEANTVIISPPKKRMNGTITIPGSKSLTNRALIISALAHGPSRLSGILNSDDSYWCIDSLRRLGIVIHQEEDTVLIEGKGGEWTSGNLYIGSAGTIARFLPGALAISTKGKWAIEASEQMSNRPVAPVIEALNQLGAEIEYVKKQGHYPLALKGKGLKGGEVSLSGKVSSQFISGLLIAAPYAKSPITIRIPDYIVQHSYVTLTLQMMEQFGADVDYDHTLQEIKVNPSSYSPQQVTLEADASTACYFLALAALTNGRIRIDRLSYGTKQPDIQMVDILEKMGCKIRKGSSFIELQGAPQLKGGFELSMRELSDQTLTLAAIAPFADAPITIREVAHIRHHESNRITAICQSLTKLGIKVEEFEDGLKIYPGKPTPSLLDSYDDHRVAMSLALIGCRVEGIEIKNPGCVSKTCPNYFEMLANLGVRVKKS